MGGGAFVLRGHIDIEARRSTELDDLALQMAMKSQEGMRPHIKGSLLVTSGLIPTHIAAQTLVV